MGLQHVCHDGLTTTTRLFWAGGCRCSPDDGIYKALWLDGFGELFSSKRRSNDFFALTIKSDPACMCFSSGVLATCTPTHRLLAPAENQLHPGMAWVNHECEAHFLLLLSEIPI